ncbi:MAG: DUF5685 family protein [Bacillota bacterium]
MFGYILPDKPEMKIKEFELFRAYYCGVCKSMGRNFGLLSRFALNYDSVFLGLFLSSVNDVTPSLKKEACFANPLKRKLIVKNNKYIDYAADINVLLTYYKMIDNWRDEKSAVALTGSKLITAGYRKSKTKNPYIAEIIEKSIAELSRLEDASCTSMDKAAEPFANMMREVLASGYEGDRKAVKDALRWTGYNLGKWVYIIDAYDDIEKDIKNSSYNPLLHQYGYTAGQDIGEFKNMIKPDVSFNILQTLSQTASSIELLELKNKGIIENIVYLGMYKKTEQLLNNFTCDSCGNVENHTIEGVKNYEKSI